MTRDRKYGPNLRRCPVWLVAVAGLSIAAWAAAAVRPALAEEGVVVLDLATVRAGNAEAARLVADARQAFDLAELSPAADKSAQFRKALDGLQIIVDRYPFTEAAVTLIGGGELAGLSLKAVLAAATAAECDRLAASPADPDRHGDAVWESALDVDAAVAACAEAVAANPSTPRIAYEYGRALALARRSEEAVIVNTSAVKAGYVPAKLNLALAYIYANGTGRDQIKGLALLKEAADAGHTAALSQLANMHAGGWFGAKDPVRANQIYRRLADAGYAPAMISLFEAYRDGRGVPKDAGEAFLWAKKAADIGYPYAQRVAAGLLRDGVGVSANPKEASRLMAAAADGGDTLGQFFRGLAFDEGDGVKKDAVAANQWFSKAAEGGYAWAHARLAVNLAVGAGSEKNTLLAAQHMYAAIRGGLPPLDYLAAKVPGLGKPFISALQTELGMDGYYQGAINGIYDAATQAAVEAAQKRGQS